MKVVWHQNLGRCIIDDQCEYLQSKNPDRTSIFVEHEGDIKEVTKSMISDLPKNRKDDINVDTLIGMLSRSLELNRRLRGTGDHSSACKVYDVNGAFCDCGWRDIYRECLNFQLEAHLLIKNIKL